MRSHVPRSDGPVRTDAEIIRAAWVRPDEFGEIFRRHFDDIFTYVARRASRDVAPDLTSETFRLAFAARHRYDPTRPSARPWLYGFATNVVRHHLRSRGREHRVFERAAVLALRPFDDLEHDRVPERLDAAPAWDRVAAALSELPTHEADTLVLLAWEGLTYAEIAEATDVPVGTVRSRVHRARSRLRELLDGSGQLPGEHPPRAQEV